MTDDELRELAEQTLTPRQLECWRLHDRGMSQRAIAYHLGVDRGTIRDHLDAAARKLLEHGATP